jgi:hypothetical protein
MTSTNGFVWPTKGPVTCDDFVADYKCGHGLHGLLWGEGVGALLNWDSNAVWLVVRVDADKIMYGKGDMIGKCKFPDGVVVCCGTVEQATEYIISNGGAGRAVAGAKATAGYSGTATAGDRGTATAGDSGTATAGYSGTATAGDSGTATAGYRGTATAGDRGIICIRWWDDANIRYRLVVGNVGENGIKENTKYRLNNQHQFVEVTT